ncbi:MAG: hypothetical protein R3B54_01570 [Bdellovibrionota bacterium]
MSSDGKEIDEFLAFLKSDNSSEHVDLVLKYVENPQEIPKDYASVRGLFFQISEELGELGLTAQDLLQLAMLNLTQHQFRRLPQH